MHLPMRQPLATSGAPASVLLGVRCAGAPGKNFARGRNDPGAYQSWSQDSCWSAFGARWVIPIVVTYLAAFSVATHGQV